jgi:ubiquinone/menaquinone biosynthesis C-methylase UbiE
MTVLDFGCGMGLFSIAMARLVGESGRVIAADLQPKMLEVLQKRAKKAAVASRITIQLCEATSTRLSEPIDFALAFYSAHEVPDLRRLLEEIQVCLRPKSKFCVVEPIGHVTRQSFEVMLGLAEEIGYCVEERPKVRMSHAAVLAPQ